MIKKTVDKQISDALRICASPVDCAKCPYQAEGDDCAKNLMRREMKWTNPPLPGAIVPDAGEMAPNGAEGVSP